jgi:hypothetical protein
VSIGTTDLRNALLHATQQVLEGNWQVEGTIPSGDTAFVVSLRSNPAVYPFPKAGSIDQYIGARIVFTSGLCDGWSTLVTGIGQGGRNPLEIDIQDTLPNALAKGDTFTIYVVPPGTPANVSQVTAAYSVGTSATAIGSNPVGRKWILVYNNGSDTIYVGGLGVTTSSGVPVPAGGPASFPYGANIQLYAISATAGQDVRTMEAA